MRKVSWTNDDCSLTVATSEKHEDHPYLLETEAFDTTTSIFLSEAEVRELIEELKNLLPAKTGEIDYKVHTGMPYVHPYPWNLKPVAGW